MGEHSLNGPSSFARRIACPGSANAERGLEDTYSIYAAEGTAAHELGETCLNDCTLTPEDFLGQTINDFEVDQDMIEAVTVYTDYCSGLINNSDEHLVEEKLLLPFIGPNDKGTADFVAIGNGVLEVVDYKHGKGVPVEVKENVQGTCYGLGAANRMHNHPWHTLKITIVQPRCPHTDGSVRSWSLSREDVSDLLLDYAYAAELTKDPDASLNVGSHCRFCKAKPTCPAQIEFAKEATGLQFGDTIEEPAEPDTIGGERLADLVLNKIPVIEHWCKSVKEHAQQVAEAGSPPPGTKLVATRAVRKFVNPKVAEKKVPELYPDIDKEKFYDVKFKTAPAVEKVVGKKNMGLINDMIDKISTGVTLVPKSDPRDDINPSAAVQFGDTTHPKEK